MPPAAGPPELIDWPLAARVGRLVAGRGPATTPELRAQVRADFAEFTRRSDALIREFTGISPATPAPAPKVLDRPGWIRANLTGFRQLVRPVAEKLAGAVPPTGIGRRVAAGALGVQIGVLLGYLSQKVLGQYDLVLASEGGGEVYYVGPNIVAAEQRWQLDERDFRLWIALHEVTHRTQFTGVPWLRERVRSLIARSVESVELDPANVRRIVARGKELARQGPGAWRAANVMTLLLSDEQREVVEEMQALMSVVEGHGTFVMNRLGEREIPTLARMQEMIERRRASARGPEKVFQRAIGLEMKMEQYSVGERFCNEVADRAGLDAVNKVWEREENLPSLEEMRKPDAWLERVQT